MPEKKLLVIVPVYNEERTIGTSIPKISEFFNKNPFSDVEIQIAIAGRQNKDNTNAIADGLEKNYNNVIFSKIDFPSKCGRIAKINLETDYDYYAFIDADLPIDLERFQEIVGSVVSDNADLAIASKYVPGAGQNREFRRVFISKAYNLMVRLLLPKIKTHDSFAGAKAWNKKVAKEIIPKIDTTTYFFDTELIYFCFDQNLKVAEIPVQYHDTRKDSKVNIFHDSWILGKDLFRFSFKRRFS